MKPRDGYCPAPPAAPKNPPSPPKFRRSQPDWLELTADGAIIKLERPLTFDVGAVAGFQGASISHERICMRHPTVEDRDNARADAVDTEDCERKLFAILTPFTAAQLAKLRLTDYMRLQEAYCWLIGLLK